MWDFLGYAKNVGILAGRQLEVGIFCDPLMQINYGNGEQTIVKMIKYSNWHLKEMRFEFCFKTKLPHSLTVRSVAFFKMSAVHQIL